MTPEGRMGVHNAVNTEEIVNKCELCGEPMPPGEEMFKFHGYSGPCPKPPLRVHNVVNMGEIVNCAGGRHVWTGEIADGDTCDCGAWYRFNDRIEQSHV